MKIPKKEMDNYDVKWLIFQTLPPIISVFLKKRKICPRRFWLIGYVSRVTNIQPFFFICS